MTTFGIVGVVAGGIGVSVCFFVAPHLCTTFPFTPTSLDGLTGLLVSNTALFLSGGAAASCLIGAGAIGCAYAVKKMCVRNQMKNADM